MKGFGKPADLYEVDGKMYTVREIAEMTGCTWDEAHRRIKLGWSIARMMEVSPIPLPANGYSEEELYDLFKVFSKTATPAAEKHMLADFMGLEATDHRVKDLLRRFRLMCYASHKEVV